MKQSFLKLLRFLCELHKEHKIAELQFSAFSFEKTGMVHSTLSFGFGGALGAFKKAMKNQVRQKLVRRPNGEHRAGPAAAAHRASVDAMFVCNEQGSFRGR